MWGTIHTNTVPGGGKEQQHPGLDLLPLSLPPAEFGLHVVKSHLSSHDL